MEEEKSISNIFLENILLLLPFLKPIKSFFFKIMNVFPRIFKKGDPMSIKFVYNFVELITLIILIIILSHYEQINKAINNDNNLKYSTKFNEQTTNIEPGILSMKTTHSLFFVFFIFLLIFNVIHTTYMYLSHSDMTGILGVIKSVIYTIPLYIIVFFSSLFIYILTNIFKWLADFYTYLINFIVYLVDKLKEIANDKDRSVTFIKYFMLYTAILGIIIFLFNKVNDSSSLNKNTYLYSLFIIIPLIIVIYYSTPFSSGNSSSVNLLIAFLIGLFFSIIIYYYLKLNSSTSLLVNYVSSIILITILILGLTNIFFILGNYFRSFTGWTGFFFNFIFYIPCLLIDFIKYVMNEFKMTTNPIYVILFLELIAILLYIYLPQILKKMATSDGIVLLPKSSFLNTKNVLIDSNIHKNKVPKEKDINLEFKYVLDGTNTFYNWFKLNIQNVLKDKKYIVNENIFNENYAFSMWIYLNTETIISNNETEIFNFGLDIYNNNNSREGKPRITYFNDNSYEENSYGMSSKNVLRIYFTNQTIPKGYYDFRIVKQKWNNLVLNMSTSKADLFINGKLEYTYYYENNIPIHKTTDFITIGQDQGLNGAICNIVYYPKNLSIIEITNNYNILMLKNPPVN